MDIFAKGALCDYWKMGSDEIEVSDNESSDLEEYMSDKEEIAKIFMIKTHVFKLCLAFNEEYVAIKEDEYNDLTITSEEACRAYQEIFQMMDEGWMDLGSKEISTNIGGEFTNLEILKCWSLETSRRQEGYLRYPWPDLEGKGLGMIQERLRSSAWCLND
ncbi:hypothetical protein Tco_1530654 [Tanacetum coccineum]